MGKDRGADHPAGLRDESLPIALRVSELSKFEGNATELQVRPGIVIVRVVDHGRLRSLRDHPKAQYGLLQQLLALLFIRCTMRQLLECTRQRRTPIRRKK